LEIRFLDAATRHLFSTCRELDARYGGVLSKKIMLRISVLQAATNLAAIPPRPPFNLRSVAKSEFLIDLVPPNVLRLVCDLSPNKDLRSIRAITILGVSAGAD
jgi:hypothetical protein